MHNVELLKTIDDGYIIASLPEPLNKIVEQLWQRRDENSFDFSLFFDSLKQDERQYVSKFLLEQEKPVDQDVFEQLIQQLYRKRWRTIVLQMKEHLAAAKQEKDAGKIEKIIARFEHLKKKILPTIHHKP